MERAKIILVCMLLITSIAIPATGLNKFSILEDKIDKNISHRNNHIGQDIDWWTMCRHDSANTGSSQSLAPDTGRIDWQTNIGLEIFSGAPILFEDKVYVSTNFYYDSFKFPSESGFSDIKNSKSQSIYDKIDDILSNNPKYFGGIYCLNSKNGNILWNMNMYAPNDAAIYNDKLYVTDFGIYSYSSNLYCLDPETGSILSQTIIPNGLVMSSTIIYEDMLYLSCMDIYSYSGEMVCTDLNGNVQWSYNVAPDEMLWGSTPAVHNGRVFFATTSMGYYGTGEGTLYCLNAETGQFLWSKPTGGGYWYFGGSIPVCSGDYVYYGNFNSLSYISQLICYEALTGNIVWSYTTGISFSSPGINGNSVYYCGIDLNSYDSKVYRFNSIDGSLIWQKTVPGFAYFGFSGSPTVADSKVYVSLIDFSGGDQNIYCLYENDGSVVWKITTGIGDSLSGLSIADGRMYTADVLGNIYAFQDHVKLTISGGLGLNLLMVNTDDVQPADVNWSIRISGGFFGFIDKVKSDICIIECGDERIERSIPFGLGDITIIVKMSVPGFTITKWLKGIAIGPFIILS